MTSSSGVHGPEANTQSEGNNSSVSVGDHRLPEHLLQAILDTNVAAITVLNTQGEFLFANTAAEQVLGLTKSELSHRTYNSPDWHIETLGGQPYPPEKLPFSRARDTGSSIKDEPMTIIWPTGERRVLSVSAYPLPPDPAKGESDPLIVVGLRDVTENHHLHDALHESEARLRQLTEAIQEVVWIRTADRMLYVNPAYEKVFGASLHSIYDSPENFLQTVHPEDKERVEAALPKGSIGRFRDTYRVVHPNGEIRWLYVQSYPVNDPEYPGRSAGTATDITQLKDYEARLQHNEHVLSMAQRIASLGHWEANLLTGEIHWSEEVFRIFGLEPDQHSPTHAGFIATVHPDDQERVEAAVQHATAAPGHDYHVEHRIVRPNGEVRHVLQQGDVLFDGEGRPLSMIGTILDITDRKQLERRLEKLATTDSLTGLYNRREFTRRAELELDRSRRHPEHTACLLMMDIDYFKRVNDLFGHSVGDYVLEEFSHLMAGHIRRYDVASRLGGEEFAIMLVETTLAQGSDKAEEIRQALAARKFPSSQGEDVQVTVSIGCTLLEATGDDALSAALNRADKALYEAKVEGRNRVVTSFWHQDHRD